MNKTFVYGDKVATFMDVLTDDTHREHWFEKLKEACESIGIEDPQLILDAIDDIRLYGKKWNE